jgi:hypothetical protein
MYPCVTPKSAHNWNPNACALAEEIETELYEALKVINPNIEYLESNNLLNHYIDQDCFQRESLTFKRDRHFSKFGHYVFSQILRKHLLNDPNYDRSILCEKPSL